jgi:hypothetical protein
MLRQMMHKCQIPISWYGSLQNGATQGQLFGARFALLSAVCRDAEQN